MILFLSSSTSLFSKSANISILSNDSFDVCELISKALKLSISSPLNSILNGSLYENEKTSIIPPLTENSPGFDTKSCLIKLNSKSFSFKSSSKSFCPFTICKTFFLISFLSKTFSKIASGYEIIIFLNASLNF